MLFKTGECKTSCTSVWLANWRIHSVANGTFDDITNLQEIYIWGTGLGCVPGVGRYVEIDRYWTQRTPRCPSNCTTDTYYLPSDNGGMCLNCPDGSHAAGIGAAGIGNCTFSLLDTTTVPTSTISSATTTTPAPLCDTGTSPFILAEDSLCVPNVIYPSPNVSQCVFDKSWEYIKSHKVMFKTGGLGKKMRLGWKVWVCSLSHPCGDDKNDLVCFTYSEFHHVFVPWGLNSELRVV
jgi:hypothetical protein